MAGLYSPKSRFYERARKALFGLLVIIFVSSGALLGHIAGGFAWLPKEAPEIIGGAYGLGLSAAVISFAIVRTWLKPRRAAVIQ
ncbi:MAG: hypothetical protein ACYTDT_10415 [Planctomycetota bacterium]|jgi:hypothetical protein